MTLPNVGLYLVLLLSIALTTATTSCVSTTKTVLQTNIMGNKVKYFISKDPDYRKGEGEFYASIDSANVQIFLSFQPNNIFKTYNNLTNQIYTLVSDNQPMLHLTSLDSTVLNKADNLLDSLSVRNLKRAKGATGFVIEVARH